MASKSDLLAGVSAEQLQAALALLAQAQQKDAQAQAREKLAQDITPIVSDLLAITPVKPSSKETSTWVGAVMGGLKVTINERTYTVQVTVKDDGASAVRKATHG